MPKSKFEEIYRDLKSKVEAGDYLYSELLPSENVLVGVYDCSRNTVRRAIAGLVEDGYVQAVHGKGVQVIYQPTEKATFTVGGIESFRETSRRNRLSPVTKVVCFESVIADAEFSEVSGFPQGSRLRHIERTRNLNGKRLILDVNYFLEDLTPGLTPEIAEQSIYAHLEGTLGIQIVTNPKEITADTVKNEAVVISSAPRFSKKSGE